MRYWKNIGVYWCKGRGACKQRMGRTGEWDFGFLHTPHVCEARSVIENSIRKIFHETNEQNSISRYAYASWWSSFQLVKPFKLQRVFAFPSRNVRSHISLTLSSHTLPPSQTNHTFRFTLCNPRWTPNPIPFHFHIYIYRISLFFLSVFISGEFQAATSSPSPLDQPYISSHYSYLVSVCIHRK